MATPITFAGSTVSISDDIPATYNEAGFEAAGVVFTPIGEVTSIGGRGRTYNDVSYTNLATRGTTHRKGSYDESELSIEIGVDRSNAGQVLLKAASDSDANHSFRIVYSNGETDFFEALTFSFADAGGDSDTIRAVTATLRVDSRGIVEATA